MDVGQILLKRELLDESQLGQLQNAGENVLTQAVNLGFVNSHDALEAVAQEMGVDFVDLSKTEVDLTLLETFPRKLIFREILFPVSRNNGTIRIATTNPLNFYPLDEISATTGLTVDPVLAEEKEIAKLIKTHLGVGGETVGGLIEQKAEEGELQLLEEIETDGSELSEMAQEASVVRLVNEILLEAIETRTSDVHIESQAEGLVVRYRIDGILHTQPMPAEINHFRAAIISRLKIMARLNIAEKRLPQDGRIKLKVHGREIDVRVSVMPMIHGEGIVMRILDKGAMVFDLQALGMAPETYEAFGKLIRLLAWIDEGETSSALRSLSRARPALRSVAGRPPAEGRSGPGRDGVPQHPLPRGRRERGPGG